MTVARVLILMAAAGALSAAHAAPASTTAPAAAAATPAPKLSQIDAAKAFAKQMLADATAALTKPKTTEAQRLVAFQDVLKKSLALDVVGKFVLGATNRSKMTPAQIARYDAAFPPYITRQYADQFKDLVGRPMEITRAVPVPRRASDTLVRAKITRKSGPPINVDWRVRKLSDGSQKIVDIIVSGVSIMTVKREEFASFIKTKGVEALLARIEKEAKA